MDVSLWKTNGRTRVCPAGEQRREVKRAKVKAVCRASCKVSFASVQDPRKLQEVSVTEKAAGRAKGSARLVGGSWSEAQAQNSGKRVKLRITGTRLTRVTLSLGEGMCACVWGGVMWRGWLPGPWPSLPALALLPLETRLLSSILLHKGQPLI